MNTTVHPSSLSGAVRVPPSKSLLHRGLFCAALAGDLSLCELPPEAELSDDIRATLDCLKKLLAGESEFFCGESGTTLRLLVPVAAARLGHARFTAGPQLSKRPIADYRDAFAGRGVACGTSLPLETRGRLAPGVFRVPGNVTSQYVSGLMLALPLLDGDSEILVTTRLESAAYVEMTRVVMRFFGVKAEGRRVDEGYCMVVPRAPKRPGRDTPYHIAKPFAAEADFSQAAFWHLAQFLGHAVAPENLPRSTSQGDSAFTSLLNALTRPAGPNARPGLPAWRETVRATRGANNRCEIDVSQIPDLVPPLAAAASSVDGETRLLNASRLRLKESDRIASTCAMLKSLGVETRRDKASLTVLGRSGRTYAAGSVDSFGDHRIVMAAAMLATRADGPVKILNSGAVKKSYPNFFEQFRQAGGVCE